MGCDIHMFPEAKNERDDWALVLEIPFRKKTWFYMERENVWAYSERDYSLFAMLAKVRGEYPNSFEPRGLPSDVCETTKIQSDEDGSDGHSHSWLLLSELLGVPWGTLTKDPARFSEFQDYLAKLKTLDPDPSKVRIVFWFDN